MKGQRDKEYAYCAPGVAHGTINDVNFYDMGIAAANLNRRDEAMPPIIRGAEISPYLDERPAVANNAAHYLLEQGRTPKEAVRLARKAVTAAPRHPGYLATLGRALLEVGQPAEAVSVLNRALESAMADGDNPDRDNIIGEINESLALARRAAEN